MEPARWPICKNYGSSLKFNIRKLFLVTEPPCFFGGKERRVIVFLLTAFGVLVLNSFI